MGDAPFKTIPGTIDIPTDLSTFKSKPQAVWTGEVWKTKGSFTPSHGDKNYFEHNPSYSINYQREMYNASENTGLNLRGDAGAVHSGNYELYGDGRWMSASVFNGLGFEVYQESEAKHAIFLKYYALVFTNRDANSWRTWGVDTGARDKSKGYRYIRVPSSSSTVSTIRTWGPSWLFSGMILHIANGGGTGSSISNMYVYNMRVGSKMSTLGGQYRMLPAGKRSYDNRKVTTGNVPFTDPFK